MWQHVTQTVLLNLILATWVLWSFWQVKERMCMNVQYECVSSLWLLPAVTHTPAPSHFLLSLSPFHSPALTASHLPLLPLPKQWSMTLSIQCSPPHRRVISAVSLHRDSITFLLNVSHKWRIDKNKMRGVYLCAAKAWGKESTVMVD